jgi:hypothetical protein
MKFTIIPTDNFIWNYDDLLDFLIANQGQSIEISTNTEGCCAYAIGLYAILDRFQFASVKIITANPLEKHPVYNIEIVRTSYILVNKQVDSCYHTWLQSYYFGTLYARPTWYRIGIATHLKTHHPEKSAVGFIAQPSDLDKRSLFEIQQLWNFDPANAVNFLGQVDTLPWRHDKIKPYRSGNRDSNDFIDETLNLYRDFLIDIVAESFISGNCFYLTEKTVRPMAMKKPFIAMGPVNYLHYLQQIGFKTFNDFWSEDYDGFADTNRYNRILTLIDEIALKSPGELLTMYQKMQDILDHNYNLLINYSQTNVIKISNLSNNVFQNKVNNISSML